MTTGQYFEEIDGGTPPTSQQLTTLKDEFKAFVVVEHTLFDTVLLNVLKSAIVAFEDYTKHPLYYKRINVTVSSVSGILVLPLLPAKDIVCSDSTIVVTKKGKSIVELKSVNPITLTYTAGFDFNSILTDISKANIKIGLFEYAKLLFESEDTKLDKVQHEQALRDVLERRFKNLYLDAYCTSLI